MGWQFATDRPIYTQLIERISLEIISGRYPLGSKLPSVRDLAALASVNPNTMQRALAELESTGLVFSERTSGRYVTTDAVLIEEARRQLANGVIDEFFRRMKELGADRATALRMAEQTKETA